jgi:hypothetical protein
MFGNGSSRVARLKMLINECHDKDGLSLVGADHHVKEIEEMYGQSIKEKDDDSYPHKRIGTLLTVIILFHLF